MINPKKQDYDIVKQRFQLRYIKLNILDFQYKLIDEISGNLIDCTFNIDANSDLRRSCNVSLVAYGKDAYKLSISPTSDIFIDKYIQPIVGIENMKTGDVQWYNQGIYLINRPTWDWDAQTSTLKFDGIDLMSKLTGIRNGQLEGIPTVIKAGSSVREAMLAAVNLGGFTRAIIEECKNTDGSIQPVPNDIVIEQGGTVYDLISQLRDILPMYQIYFDVDGVFRYERIPTGENEPILLDDNTIKDILISESINTDFEAVKNYIEVYGRTHDIQHFATAVSITTQPPIGNVPVYNLNLTIPSIETMENGTLFGWTMTTDLNGYIDVYINGQSAGALYLYENATELVPIKVENNNSYCAVLNGAQDGTLFLGHIQAKALAYDNNLVSPFYVDGSVGRIRYVCYGGDYDNIQSDALAKERAEYELYLRCRLQDTISLYIIPVPWLDVNVLIKHIAKDDTLAKEYMIQSISWSIGNGETMTIIANQYYPLYNK